MKQTDPIFYISIRNKIFIQYKELSRVGGKFQQYTPIYQFIQFIHSGSLIESIHLKTNMSGNVSEIIQLNNNDFW